MHTTGQRRGVCGRKEIAKARVVLLRAAVPGRGLNERANGLLRQCFPKTTGKLDPAELKRVENLLDNRPRKALDYRTPAEAFMQGLTGAE